ncbi:hypothetical protein [Streptomyces sp. NPDC093676]|uniref:hypothetical protein n=1 Tax=Streptomyces sp. NPDC093676 TaxID=3366050 RepID=UPI003823F3C6
MTVDLPLPVVVTRHQCPHCRRYTRARRDRVKQHMARCWQNPAARACKTCVHYEPADPDGPYPEHPGWPEGCAQDRDLANGLHVHCPSHTPTGVAR